MAGGKGHMLATLKDVVLSVDDSGSLVLGLKYPMYIGYFQEHKENLQMLQDIIGEVTGKHVNIVIKDLSNARERVAITDLRDILKNVTIEVEE